MKAGVCALFSLALGGVSLRPCRYAPRRMLGGSGRQVNAGADIRAICRGKNRMSGLA
jgi:hypothetical protein